MVFTTSRVLSRNCTSGKPFGLLALPISVGKRVLSKTCVRRFLQGVSSSIKPSLLCVLRSSSFAQQSGEAMGEWPIWRVCSKAWPPGCIAGYANAPLPRVRQSVSARNPGDGPEAEAGYAVPALACQMSRASARANGVVRFIHPL